MRRPVNTPWLAAEMTGLGFAASVRPTAGHSVVVAHGKSARPSVPHVLFYGHYDVQPVDPLAPWTTDPFKAVRVMTDAGEQIVARGASDDKGQIMTFLEACRAFTQNGGLPCDVTILFEGEEETGSPSLPAFLADNRAELKADLALICDTGMWDAGTPAITTMLRGLVLDEVVIRGAIRDLHSGLFGGGAINPIHVLARIIADLHGADGRVALPGFYDDVEDLPRSVYDLWKALPFKQADFLGDVGLSVPVGEPERMMLERIWSRPTCDVNGITGGYQGQGSKAVVPCQASAKFSFRLVGAQNPATIREAFRSFVHARLPADCRAEFIPHGAFPAIRVPVTSDSLERGVAEGARARRSGWLHSHRGRLDTGYGYGPTYDRL
jgi:acetylornithine deacetylase/succinyl-diaminopimelate desuccinylase-like protein